MYICSRSVCTKPGNEVSCISALEVYVPSQESELSCISALEVYVPSQESEVYVYLL